jgi:hypothetical protein
MPLNQVEMVTLDQLIDQLWDLSEVKSELEAIEFANALKVMEYLDYSYAY